MPARPVLELFLGDVIELRRPHVCGASTWLVDRLGVGAVLLTLSERGMALIERDGATHTTVHRIPTTAREV